VNSNNTAALIIFAVIAGFLIFSGVINIDLSKLSKTAQAEAPGGKAQPVLLSASTSMDTQSALSQAPIQESNSTKPSITLDDIAGVVKQIIKEQQSTQVSNSTQPNTTFDPNGYLGTVSVPDWSGQIQEPTLTPTPTIIPVLASQPKPWKTVDELVKTTIHVLPKDAVPGDIVITGGKAYTLLKDGVIWPYGVAVEESKKFVQQLQDRPDLVLFIEPSKSQPGDIFSINDEIYTLLDGGYSLLYKDPSAQNYIEISDTSKAQWCIRMRAGNVPEDTPGLQDADVILRIRPDVEVKKIAMPTLSPTPTPKPTATNTPIPEPELIKKKSQVEDDVQPIATNTPVRVPTNMPLKPTEAPKQPAKPTPVPIPTLAPVPAKTEADKLYDAIQKGIEIKKSELTPTQSLLPGIDTNLPKDSSGWQERLNSANLPSAITQVKPYEIDTSMPTADEWAKRLGGK